MTRKKTSAHGFTEGDLVRIKKTGKLVRLESVNETDRWKEDEIFAYGYVLEEGSFEILSPDDIEKVEEPKIEVSDIVPEIASALHGGFDDILSVSETQVDGGDVYVYGTFNGVPIEFTVRAFDLGIRI